MIPIQPAAQTTSLRDMPITALRGVGPKTAEKLVGVGMRTVFDVLLHLPTRYEDRSRVSEIASLRDGESATVLVRVVSSRVVFARKRMLQCQVKDDTGVLSLRFFYFNKTLQQAFSQVDAELCLFGLVRRSRSGLEMIHPSYEFNPQPLSAESRNEYTPIYRTLQGLSNVFWQKLTGQACALLQRSPSMLLDAIPASIRGEMRLPTLSDALLFVHKPPLSVSYTVLESRSHPMLKRLALEELIAHQLSYELALPDPCDGAAPSLVATSEQADSLCARLVNKLPFTLTHAQQRVWHEIEADCISAKPMFRLLQGDVGSGKTLVAALAACQAVDSGFQVAIMAPTEILVSQHKRSFEKWLSPLGVAVDLLVGSQGAKQRRECLSRLAAGETAVLIGTHALFQAGVEFDALGLVIIDEQHRFGVSQRLALRDKGSDNLSPHQLVMTATPIPRSLAMTAYAHCQHSIIDELPPGRHPIQTVVMAATRSDQLVARLREQLRDGARAYWVCPIIESSESLPVQAIETRFEVLREQLPDYRIAMLHGKMSSDEKEAVMSEFSKGLVQVLVATTVIEVGVDVPEATVMVIESAERFGLAQLHQLRGRVGRGEKASFCLLLYGDSLGRSGQERLQVMHDCADGFKVAEADLELRGPGEILGAKQAGLFQFQIACWQRDADLLEVIQTIKTRLGVAGLKVMKPLLQGWINSQDKWLQG